MRDCDGSYGWDGMLESLKREGGLVGGKVV